MSDLVDVDKILQQTREIEHAKSVEENHSLPLPSPPKKKIEETPKKSFWQKLFGKKEKQTISPTKRITDSQEELKQITELRKNLGTDMPLPSQPDISITSPLERKPSNFMDEELSVEINTLSSSEQEIPSKEHLKKLRSKLGLDEVTVDTKQLYDTLEEESNNEVDEQVARYEQEQKEIEDQHKEEQLITTHYQEPLEIEDHENEQPLEIDEQYKKEPRIQFQEEQPEPEELTQNTAWTEHIEDQPEEEHTRHEFLETTPIEEPKDMKKEPLFHTEPEIVEEPQENDWEYTDQTIEQDFSEQSSKTLEEENFIISEMPELPVEELTEFSQQEQVQDQPKEEKLPEKTEEERIEEQLEKTNHILEELEHGEVPIEDLLMHLEKGIEDCTIMLQKNRLLDAKYKYNQLSRLFQNIPFEEDEKTKWFGVLKKMYERILDAEKNSQQ